MTDRNRLILLAAGGSLALLLGALAFQYLGGLKPCQMCIEQRWPHLAAVLFGVAALVRRGPVLPACGAISALATSALGLYHTGVERAWWQGPTTCTSGAIDGVSADDLLNQILAAPVIRCDEVQWQMFGLSMASWNSLISLGLAAIWVMAVVQSLNRRGALPAA